MVVYIAIELIMLLNLIYTNKSLRRLFTLVCFGIFCIGLIKSSDFHKALILKPVAFNEYLYGVSLLVSEGLTLGFIVEFIGEIIISKIASSAESVGRGLKK